jgi:hypothetical protein
VVAWGHQLFGKSFWVFDLLMHVALGANTAAIVFKQGSIDYCALEGAKGFEKRREVWRRENLANKPDGDPPFFLMSVPLSLKYDAQALVADMKTELADDRPLEVCIHPQDHARAATQGSHRSSRWV